MSGVTPTQKRSGTRDAVARTAPMRRRGGNRWLGRVLIFVTCVLVLDALFGDRGLAETMRARRDFARVQTQIQVVKRENAGLREEARRLQQDPRRIEAVARRELGLIRPGEILIVVRDMHRGATGGN